MRRFTFRLDTVLELRKRREDEIKRELAQKNREVLDAKQRLASINDALAGIQAEEMQRRRKTPDILTMRATVVYRSKLKNDILSTAAEIEWLRQQGVEVQQRLTKAVQARRAIELLREHRYALWRKESGREQQAAADEASQQKFSRLSRARQRTAAERRSP